MSTLRGRLAPIPRAAGAVPWAVLAALSTAVLVVQLPGRHATAWHFFHDAARLLVGDGPTGASTGLHLYGDRPDLQFGPLNAVVALPFTVLGETGGGWAAMVASSALGLLALRWLFDAVERVRPAAVRAAPPRTLLAAGALFVVTWGDVAVRTAHIDDAIALAATACALRAVAGRQGLAAALALGVAAAAKPWAVAFAPLVLAVPAVADPQGRERGQRWPRRVQAPHVAWLAVALAVPALTWAPFVLAEPATLDTAGHAIANDPTSVLRVLGVDDPTTPGWARPAQLAGGAVVVAGLVLLGRWHGAVLAGVAWRLLLEPGANRYYTIGLVVGALFLELVARPSRVPVATIAAAAVLELTALPDAPAWSGWARAAVVAAALAASLQLAAGSRLAARIAPERARSCQSRRR